MKVSLNWLKEFVDIKLKAEDLAEKIALSVVEVEEIVKFSEIFKNVLVGEIKEIKKHPNGDNLSIAKVSVGKKRVQVIIGQGLTMAVGTKLPIVVAPATLPSGMVIEKRSIRGVESQGMIGSNKDLGLDWLDGEITFFDKNVKVGASIAKVLDLDDVILDLDVLSNRPDLFSHIGVAREVAAIAGKKLKTYSLGDLKEVSSKRTAKVLEVEVIDKKLCPRYEARVIDSVKIKESPEWLRNRLAILGIRPVNNIVDITNYVMVELGQPMHAYDFSTLSGGKKKKILVRKSKVGEDIATLDGKKRRLAKDILLITDGVKPIGVAGIMGGKETEVTDKTKSIILEAASFSWPAIRKASRLLGLRSEAVGRFEKGLDPNMTSKALDRAAYLVATLAKGDVFSGKIDENNVKNKQKNIELSVNKVNKFLGVDYDSKMVSSSLNLLGMETIEKGDFIEVRVPSFRMDIKEDIDLIEDVARIIGYDKIPVTDPVGKLVPPKSNYRDEREQEIKNVLRGAGGNEVFTYSFIGDELIRTFKGSTDNFFELKNPLKPEQTYLRDNLIYSLAELAVKNSKNFPNFNIFEISNVFIKEDKLLGEKRKIGIASLDKDSFFEAKGLVEGLFAYFNVRGCSFDQSVQEIPYFHPKRTTVISAGKEQIGVLGELHPEIQSKYALKDSVTICEIDFDKFISVIGDKLYKPYSKYPSVSLDLAIVVDERVSEAKIRETIFSTAKNMISELDLFDIYRGSQISVGEKSLAYHIKYQVGDRTLTEAEVKPIHDLVLAKLKKEFNATLRS